VFGSAGLVAALAGKATPISAAQATPASIRIFTIKTFVVQSLAASTPQGGASSKILLTIRSNRLASVRFRKNFESLHRSKKTGAAPVASARPSANYAPI
jgi:hypothetical protein